MVLKVNVELLRKLPLLADLSDESCEELLKFVRLQVHTKGSYVIRKGTRGGDLFFVLQGRLLVVDELIDGRQMGINFLNPGDFFGELSLIDELPRSASILSVSPSIVLGVAQHKAKALIYQNPAVAERMLKHVAIRLRASTDYRSLLGIPHAFQRVCALVQMLARPDPGRLLTIENAPTHQHLALMVNSSRETVSRAFQVLFEQGVLEKDNRRLIVRDPKRLAQLSQEAALPA